MSRHTRRWLTATVLAFVIGVAVASAGASLGALGAAPRLDPAGLGRFFLGATLVRAEAVTKDPAGLHDYRIDQGRVRAVTGDSLKLRERNGDLVTVPVAPGATIRVGGRPASLAQIRAGSVALTIRDGGVTAPATLVRATAR
jgi:hypothetical protein